MALQASSQVSGSEPSSPVQLTPKSKVRAILAVLDSDSDGETSSLPINLASPPKMDQESVSGRDLIEENLSNILVPTKQADDEDEDEDKDGRILVKPRGGISARMHTAPEYMDADTDQVGDDARGRVKKLLLSKDNKSTDAHEGTESFEGSESDNGITSISKKRRIRRTRGSTPKSSPLNNRRASSNSLFGSSPPNKPSSPATDASGSEDDLPTDPGANPRFLALVQKMREERLGKEAEAIRQKAAKAVERSKISKHHSDLLEEDNIEFSDDDGGKQLTQQVRPTRKASKRVLEEMHRETQRMSRNMQLAHEARTKKKITKASLFAKFNYKPAYFVENESVSQAPLGSSSPILQSDAELKDTPPTSPISLNNDDTKARRLEVDSRASKIDIDEFPRLEGLQSSSPSRPRNKLVKGKRKAPEEPSPFPSNNTITRKQTDTFTQRPIRIRRLKIPALSIPVNDDSDSDLEIITAKTPIRRTKDSIFDRIPAQAKESHSLQALRMLAHLTSPGRLVGCGNTQPSVTASELQISLQQRARQQAAREREERLQALRDRGVIVQTAEEREKETAEVEDLIAKARREGEEIMKREKEAAKRERKAKGELDPLGESSDDEEWKEGKEFFTEQMSESGSESDYLSDEEDIEDEDEENFMSAGEDIEEAETNPTGHLIDGSASETDTAEDEELTALDNDMANIFNDDTDDQPIVQPRRRTKQLVVSDDEDEDIVTRPPVFPHTDSPLVQQTQSPIAPPSVLRSATKTFIPGLTIAGPAGLGLTQIFAGTMDDSQTQSSQLDTAQDSLAFLRNLPAPGSRGIVRDNQTQISHIPDSPLNNHNLQDIQLQFTQSQIHGFDSLVDPLATQISDFPEPTQDAGFQAISPIQGRFVQPPPSTIDTLILENTPVPEDINTSPVVKKKGKLRRRNNRATPSGDGKTQNQTRVGVGDMEDFEISANAFDLMRKASKRKRPTMLEFDRKKSGAKEMVEEQAQESEDEYAGLGGASDDDSGGEEDAYVKEMIDDEGVKDLNASKLAAFYADRERASDEKQVEKLFKDITNGMLRRKRGADYGLSDSDDDGEARRRMKRKEFAKMRKALLEDERIGKIAENPKKLAFLRAIEDRGEDDEMDFLDDAPESQEATNSAQSQSQREDKVNESQPNTITGQPKRKISGNAEPEIRLPPHLRRTKPNKRPSSLAEIRESLSSLIEEPSAMIASRGSGSESEVEDEDLDVLEKERGKENRDPFAYRRTKNVLVVDRISLKRAASSTTSAGARLAFMAPSSTPSFKVPALLRRATTNSSISSGSNTSSLTSVSGTERSAGGFSDDGRAVAKKAGKNSGVNYFARENERRMAVKEGEKRREQKMWKGAEKRRKIVRGLFGTGKFE